MFSEKGRFSGAKQEMNSKKGVPSAGKSQPEKASVKSSKEIRRDPEEERRRVFRELRLKTHAEMELDVADRIKNNPKPTEEEILAGTFREEIEPQVRDAVFELRRKGYSCSSSGFGGEGADAQAIDGYFEVDENTKKKLEELGVSVQPSSLGEGYTEITMRPSSPDLAKIAEIWNKVAEVLPDQGRPADPSISGGAEEFRNQYAADRTDVERDVLRLRLAKESYHPDVERRMRQRLEELGG